MPVSMHGPSTTPQPVTVEVLGAEALVAVTGDLDLSLDDAFTTGLASGISSAIDGIVVDLAACHFIGSRSFAAIHDASVFLETRGQTLEVRGAPASYGLIGDALDRADRSGAWTGG